MNVQAEVIVFFSLKSPEHKLSRHLRNSLANCTSLIWLAVRITEERVTRELGVYQLLFYPLCQCTQ